MIDLSFSPSVLRSAPPILPVCARLDIALVLRELLQHYYVHLPIKASSLAIDPIAQASLLIDDVPLIQSDHDFFSRVRQLVNGLRDRHTVFTAPSPYKSLYVSLPIGIEVGWSDGRRRAYISKVDSSLADPSLIGSAITHWNGTPIGRYVEALSWEMPGANPYARIQLAIRTLTVRLLAYSALPNEDWVMLTLESRSESKSLLLQWSLGQVPIPSGNTSFSVGQGSLATAIQSGIDYPLSALNDTWALRLSSTASASQALKTIPPYRFEILSSTSGSADVGYIRLFSFGTDSPHDYVRDFARQLKLLPTNGVVIDVRSNPGGCIPAGHGIAQLFSSDPIEPSRVSFRATERLRDLVTAYQPFQLWAPSLRAIYEIGDLYSLSFPIADISWTQEFAGTYQGPVVIICDALSYSTTDFFLADMKDNGLAYVIGEDELSGAGGANVWSYSLLRELDALTGRQSLKALPLDADISIALRRGVRSGYGAGLPLEGLGVSVDQLVRPSLDDLININSDLIDSAIHILSQVREHSAGRF